MGVSVDQNVLGFNVSVANLLSVDVGDRAQKLVAVKFH